MAKLTFPIYVNLPDDWIEQIVDRLRNDPESEWVEIIRCRDCRFLNKGECEHNFGLLVANDDDYCSLAERKDE